MILTFFLTLQSLAAEKPLARNYHPMAIVELAAENPSHWVKLRGSHVATEGFVTYLVREGDGDLHVRLCDSKLLGMDRAHCIVAEVIPTTPDLLRCATSMVKLGQRLKVWGIARFDAEGWNPDKHEGSHGWWEVHPVEKFEVQP